MRAETSGDIEGMPVRPLPDGSDIRKVREEDVPRVADAVAASFYEDPIFRWVFRDPSRRLRRLEGGLDLYVRRVWLRHGECYTTDRLIGGAFWLPPGTWHLGALEQIRLLPAMAARSRGDVLRLLRLLNLFEKMHPHDTHWYLPVIGVDPKWHGRGFGSALLKPILELCDSEALPAYLEATSSRNRALYERNGFEVIEEFRVADDSPPGWTMRREPGT